MPTNRSLFAARACLALTALLCLSALCLCLSGGARTECGEQPSPGDAMARFQLDRDALREREIAELLAMADDSRTDAQTRALAQRRVMELRRWMEQEATIEAVLAARGWQSALVTVHAGSVNVLVRAGRLERADAAVLLELVSRETGVTGGNIKVVPVD